MGYPRAFLAAAMLRPAREQSLGQVAQVSASHAMPSARLSTDRPKWSLATLVGPESAIMSRAMVDAHFRGFMRRKTSDSIQYSGITHPRYLGSKGPSGVSEHVQRNTCPPRQNTYLTRIGETTTVLYGETVPTLRQRAAYGRNLYHLMGVGYPTFDNGDQHSRSALSARQAEAYDRRTYQEAA